MDMVIILFFIGLFIVLGTFLINGKGAFLIAGYNTMPQGEKEKFDVGLLCKFMGKMMFTLSFSMLFWAASIFYDNDWLFIFGLILFIAIVIFMLVYANTGNRFKK